MSLRLRFEVPTWDQIYEMLLNLAEKIHNDRFCPDMIVGIARGGWPPARVMSDLLGNPKLGNIGVEFYLGIAEPRSEPVITQPVSIPVAGAKVLVLDDVADTGKSLQLVKGHVMMHGANEVKIATIYYKPWSIIKPDYYEKKTRKWIVFPWERKETVRNLIRNYEKEGIPIVRIKDRLVHGGMDQGLLERFINEVIKEE